MTIPEPYRDVIEQVLNRLREELGTDLVGVLLGGSVAAGNPAPNSDVNLQVIIRPPWRQRRTWYIQGVEVEILLLPAHEAFAEFQNPDRVDRVHLWATGRILMDTGNTIKGLVAEAQSVWKQGPAPPPSLHPNAEMMRHVPLDRLKDAQDLLDVDPAAAVFMIFCTLQSALELHYKLQRRWSPKLKHLLADLAELDPKLAEQARLVLDPSRPLKERWETVSKVVHYVIKPLGGPLGGWESPRETLPEPSSK